MLVALLTLVAGVAAAVASKKVDSSAGSPTGQTTPAIGGILNSPTGVAVNNTTKNFYVADPSNNRIQQFDAANNFVRAWGRDVIAPSVSEIQLLTVTASTGKFKLEFNGQITNDLESNSSSSTVQTALRGLSTITGSNVNVSGGPGSASGSTPYLITFAGTLANANQNPIVVQPGSVPLAGNATITTLADGIAAVPSDLGTVFEKCAVAGQCKAGITSPGAPGGTMSSPQGVAINQSNGHVYVDDSSFLRMQEFEENGAFVRAWGAGVTDGGATGTGNITTGSTEVTTVVTTSKAFLVGQTVTGEGIPANTIITTVTTGAGAASKLILSQAATETKSTTLTVAEGAGNNATNEQQTVTVPAAATSGTFKLKFTTTSPTAEATTGATGTGNTDSTTKVITGVTTTTGAFVVGEAISGTNIPADAIISEVDTGAGTITFTSATNATGTGAVGNLAANIPFNASAATVQAALEKLTATGLGVGNVAVTLNAGGNAGGGASPGGPWTVEFKGARFADTNVNQMTQVAGVPPLSSGSVAIATAVEGAVGPEVCTQAATCKAGVSSALGGGFASTFNGFPAVSPAGSPNAGNVVVPDPGNRRVQEFTSAGAFVRAWGWDVVQTGGTGDTNPTNQLEICTASSQCKAGASAGAGAGQFANNSPNRAAVDTTGKIYLVDNGNNRVQSFNSAAGSPADFATATLSGSPTPTNIAIGPSNNIFVTKACPGGTPPSQAVCPGATTSSEIWVREFNSAGVLQDNHMVAAGFTTVNGLAANPNTDKIYVSTSSGTPGSRVWTLDNDGAGSATMVLNPPTEVTAHTATVTGTVTPNGPAGISTGYRFQVSHNGVTWTDVNTESNLGDGTSPIAVGPAPITGLEANTFYRIRLVTRKAFGNPEIASAELTFSTDTVGPEVKSFNPISIVDTGATLRGQINPNNLPTTYYFEYGKDTNYGSKVPVPAADLTGGADNQIYQDVNGLEPDTTYHVRLVAANSEGTTKGEDVIFVTRSSTPAEGGRAWEMMTPPFKALPSSFAGGVGGVFNNPNPGVPSLDGNAMMWANSIFPLSDDNDSPNSGDMRLMRRTADGWTFETRNTLPLKTDCPSCGPGESQSLSLVRVYNAGSSGDMETIAPYIGGGASNPGNDAWFLPVPGGLGNRIYTRRDGTGNEGWSGWMTNPSQQVEVESSAYVINTADAVRFNDDGSAQARSWYYRGLADDPETSLDEDPSNNQQLTDPSASGGLGFKSRKGGTTVYLQRADTPEEMPSAPKELVNGCTGTGSAATQIPVRVGTGASTDTIGASPCEQYSGGPVATGSVTRTSGSATLTGVTTATGAFQPGQLVGGPGISPGTTINSVGAGTLTLNQNVTCGGPPVNGTTAEGSATITNVAISNTTCGTELFVGQIIFITGIFGGGSTHTITTVDNVAHTIGVTPVVPSSDCAFGFCPASFTATTGKGNISAENLAVTSQRGAALGDVIDEGSGTFSNMSATAMSEDGSRVFFRSPSGANSAEGLPASGCTSATGLASVCVPQLFIHQLDESGNPTVRWISRAQGVGAQQIAELGNGANFEGASRDGRYVYFKTNAPLLPNDPNGGSSITTGSASNNSFDLYRYALPASLNDDPAGGTLTRISGGPSGTADPSTNNNTADGGTFGMKVGAGAALRYLSDDGKLAYFVTTSPIAGADAIPARGAVTTPGGTVGNGTQKSGTRDLYLFDDTGGSPQWRYVASLPFASFVGNSADPAIFRSNLDACASSGEMIGELGTSFPSSGNLMNPTRGDCFRGTQDGKDVLFTTNARLTADDTDDASDIYLYDYERDELTRVSAPPAGATPYPCGGTNAGGNPSLANGSCNADLGLSLRGNGTVLSTAGFGSAGSLANARGWAGSRNYNIAKDADGVVSVFFESKSNLTSEDTDTQGRMDVYRWHNGKLTLMTPEFPDLPFWYSGSSLSGRDLFVDTPARIDPREIDALDYDVYDLRVGGGFPYEPPATPCDVLAHQCRSTALPAPAPEGSATAGFSGAGNVTAKPSTGPKHCGKGKVRKGKKCVKKKKSKRTASKTGRASR